MKCKWEGNEFVGCEKTTEEWEEGYTFEELMNKKSYRETITMNYCPFCGTLLKKPVVVEVGMFGYFSGAVDNGFNYPILAEWGILDGMDGRENNLYRTRDSSQLYKSFTPGLPSGYNQDGSKI